MNQYLAVRWLFLRLLGGIFGIAFLSLWLQVDGLMGGQGILPAGHFLAAARAQLGPKALELFPSLLWLNSSDAYLHALCIGGLAASVLLALDLLPFVSLLVCWLFYLSLFSVGQVFLGYQWDILLLETGFLSFFVTPLKIFPGMSREREPSESFIWVLRFLLFRLMFMSGFVKLASGDPVWRDLTALKFHFQTQPLPTVLGWWAHQLPERMLVTACVIVYAIEMLIPFLMFCGRRARLAAFVCLVFLQVLIELTGNYCFFNLLTIALCLLLLDDAYLQRFFGVRVPGRWQPALPSAGKAVMVHSLAGVFIALSALVTFAPSTLPSELRRPISSLHLANTYGLFAVMTTERREIILEGSLDGETWHAYEFKWKPGDLKRMPGFVAPHQPRLDWQMWFAALGSCRDNSWFLSFLGALLRNKQAVTALLEVNPFATAPPKFIRTRLYRYEFTSLPERRQSGDWWKRTELGLYCPTASLPE